MKLLIENNIVENTATTDLLLNRSFYFGDGFFETILFRNGKFPLLHFHFERIIQSCKILNCELNADFTVDFFQKKLNDLIIANHCDDTNAIVKINFFRSGESAYKPQQNEVKWIAQIKPFKAAKEKISLCFYEEEKKWAGEISKLKSTNALIYVLAAQYASKQNIEEAVVFNQYDFVADCTNSNLFIIKEKKIFTPSLNDGGVDGVCRKFLLKNFPVEEKNLTKNDLLQADEIFLTNAVRFIQPVFQLENKIYEVEQATVLQQQLFRLLD
jgi:branched-chain amino acid aminotransferase